MRERRDAIHIKLFDAVSDTCSPRAVVVVNQIGKGKTHGGRSTIIKLPACIPITLNGPHRLLTRVK